MAEINNLGNNKRKQKAFMDSNTAQLLRDALSLLRDGNKNESRKLLVQVLREDDSIEQAWFMLSYAVDDYDRQIKALKQVLKLNPENEKAQERMVALRNLGAVEEQKAPEPVDQTEEAGEQFQSEDQVDQGAAQDADLLSQRLMGGAPAEDGIAASPEVSETKVTVETDETDESIEEVEGEDSSEIDFDTVTRPKQKRFNINFNFIRKYVIIGLLVLLFICGGTWAVMNFNFPASSSEGSDSGVTPENSATPTNSPLALPPTWTPSPVSTQIPLPPATQVPYQTFSTPSIGEASQPIQDNIISLQARIEDIRGREAIEVTNYNISGDDLDELVEALFTNSEVDAQADVYEHLFTALGMLDSNYSFQNYFINIWAQQGGAIWVPELNNVYFTGLSFNPIAQSLYAQAYTQILVSEDISGLYPVCVLSLQQCDALRALTRGDGAVVSQIWADRYLNGDELSTLDSFLGSPVLISDYAMPDFVEADLDFGYEYGGEFVSALRARGGWANVNLAYLSPPSTTEQIMHPNAYVIEEGPIDLEVAHVINALDDPWEQVFYDSIGEWRTYQFLAYQSDVGARIDLDDALLAAEGWGNDVLQVLYNAEDDEYMVAGYWIWDSVDDSNEFFAALETLFDDLYQRNRDEHNGLTCWLSSEEVSCLVQSEDVVFWVRGPNYALIDSVISQITIE